MNINKADDFHRENLNNPTSFIGLSRDYHHSLDFRTVYNRYF